MPSNNQASSGSTANQGSTSSGQSSNATSNSSNTKSNSSGSGSSNYSIIKEGWGGSRTNFQGSYGLKMTSEDIEEGNAILDAFREQDSRK